MEVSTIGIIGYGGFGRFLHSAWDAMAEARVVAVADTNPSNDPGTVRFFTDWQALLKDPAIDIVSIATPPVLHASMACAALEAGKHVLVEKPLAMTVEEAQRIQAVAERTGKCATVNFMLRFNPIVEALQAWSHSRCFGALRRVVVENYAQDEALPPEHWFWDPTRSGGILVEHAVHFIDIVNGCTKASPEQVQGLGVRRTPTQEDRMMLTVKYADGLVATQYHAFSRPQFFEQTSMRFVFDIAQVEVEGWIPMRGRVTALVSDATEAELQRLPDFAIHRQERLATATGSSTTTYYSGGQPYTVSHQVEGGFALPISKPEAYADALRALMRDLIAAGQKENHRLRVSLQDGISTLRVALEATQQAH